MPEYFTVGYNLVEGLVSLVLGGRADSIALIGFGLDSFVESFSGIVVLRRFRDEARGETEHALAEARALEFVGWSFFLLAAYIAIESIRKLWARERPKPSIAGIVLSLLSLIVMSLPSAGYVKQSF